MAFFNKQMDYRGQELCEKIMFYILIAGYFVSVIAGLVMKNLLYTLIVGAIFAGSCIVLTFFPWSFYRRNKLNFKKKVE